MAAVVFCIAAGSLPASAAEGGQPPNARTQPSDSAPLKLRPVPNLKGKRITVARQLLRLREFKAASGVFYIAPENWRDDIQPDVVSMQTPQPNSLVPEGTTIAFWVFRRASVKQKLVATPDLRGLAPAQATDKLIELGLRPLATSEGDRHLKARTIADHYPKPKQQVFVGTAVYLRFQDQPMGSD